MLDSDLTEDMKILRKITHRLNNLFQSMGVTFDDMLRLIEPRDKAADLEDKGIAQLSEMRIMLGVIWDILAVQHGSFRYNPTKHKLDAVVGECCALLNEQGVSLVQDIPKIDVFVDSTRLRWFILKYVRDAIRNLIEAEIDDIVHITARRGGEQVHLSVGYPPSARGSNLRLINEELEFCKLIFDNSTIHVDRMAITIQIPIYKAM